jgi:hypothetical protein
MRLVSRLLPFLLVPALAAAVPSDPSRLEHTISYAEMEGFLHAAARPGLCTVTEEGRSHQGRSIFLVHLNRGGAKARFKVLLYAQQHGNEISGKDAQLCLVRAICERPTVLPEDVDLWLMPMVNPDGAEANQRFNGIGKDLNRDHILLFQPETQTLHKVARRILPHLAVDCHEFTRDGKDWDEKGWDCWPLITLDGLNLPWIPEGLKRQALATVESARPVMAKAGFPYTRYSVGGIPPLEEVRPSTTEVDDGRNSLGCLGTLSFIIEAGVKRNPGAPDDLGRRAAAYTTLFRHLLGTPASRRKVEALCEAARKEPLPPFLATNFFWANLDGRIRTIRVVERATGRPLDVPTPCFMTDLVVKQSVPTPSAYVIDAAQAPVYRDLLERHGLRYEVLAAPATFKAERCRLLRVETAADESYDRYPNRQIVARDAAASHVFPAGSLVVTLDQPLARSALGVLEPCLLYGLYSYPEFRGLALPDGTLPVWRKP